jgi:hypothetical protein
LLRPVRFIDGDIDPASIDPTTDHALANAALVVTVPSPNLFSILTDESTATGGEDHPSGNAARLKTTGVFKNSVEDSPVQRARLHAAAHRPGRYSTTALPQPG